MQNLTSWSYNDHENGEESAQNYQRDLVVICMYFT